MASIEDILTVAEDPSHRRTATVRILLHQNLEARHRDLERRLAEEIELDNRLNREPVAPDIADEIRSLEAEIEAAKVPFTFAAIGKRAWSDLLAQHPPTAEQRQHGRADFNADTFPAAAVAACALEPTISWTAAVRLEAALNSSQFDLLWGAVIDVNVGGVTSPKSFIAGRTRRPNGGSATTAAPEESLAASSLDE
jgi:hypothetical protein